MIIKKVNRYFCEFCRRGALAKRTMLKHEKGCTLNPERVCGLCEYGGLKQKPIDDLVATLTGDKLGNGLDELKSLADGCPGCILAAIRQSHVNDEPYSREEGPPLWYEFKTELEKFWQQANEDRQSASDTRDIQF